MDIFLQSLISRLRPLAYLIFFAVIGILLYLSHLQINLNVNFFQRGEQNFLRYEKVASARGNITDMYGNLLATNRPINVVYWQGTGQAKLSSEQLAAVNKCLMFLDIPYEKISDIAQAEKQGKKLCIYYDARFDQISKLIEQFPIHSNISVERLFKRYYPHGKLASHIVGYLSLSAESTGKMGLELLCDTALRGEAGKMLKIINSMGRYLDSCQIKKSLTGESIQTTLDVSLQRTAETLFDAYEAGTCILMDAQTGAIEVMLSRPTFDPNIFLSPLDIEQWQNLQEQKCFINRAINACYPPASPFKLVTVSAALEHDIIDNATSWHCMGHIPFAGRLYHCAQHAGHGIVDIQKAIACSCNIPFFDIGKKIKIDMLANYAYKFGLGRKTNFIFKEKAGLVPTSHWKRTVKGEQWWCGETLSAVIGQSYLLVTPLQIARMICAIGQGYLVRPRILAVESIDKQPLMIKESTREVLLEAMKLVATEGTACRLRKLTDFQIYAKTGTAQTSSLANRKLGKHHIEHAWFVAYFQYKQLPSKALVILIENVGSAQVATRFAHNFFRHYAAYYNK